MHASGGTTQGAEVVRASEWVEYFCHNEPHNDAPSVSVQADFTHDNPRIQNLLNVVGSEFRVQSLK